MKHNVGEILDVLERLIPDHSPIVEIDYLTGGYSNQNYRVHTGHGDYVLRLCLRAPTWPDAEISYLNLPLAPRLVAYDRSKGHMVTELVRGALLVQAPFTVEESAHYLREIHAAIPMGIRRHDPISISLDHFKKAGIRNDLREFVETTKWRPRLEIGCHNDLNPYNIVKTTDGSVVTLDWEFAGDNEGLFDLVNLCYGLGYSDEEFDRCAALYSCSQHDSEYLVLTRLLFQVREHSWALAQIALGNDRGEIRAQANEAEAEFQRIRRKYS